MQNCHTLYRFFLLFCGLILLLLHKVKYTFEKKILGIILLLFIQGFAKKRLVFRKRNVLNW